MKNGDLVCMRTGRTGSRAIGIIVRDQDSEDKDGVCVYWSHRGQAFWYDKEQLTNLENYV